ncbi:MAG: 3D domain-containing protein [Aquabacterium sp.]
MNGEEDPDVEHFELAELAAPAQEEATAGMDDTVTRGGRSRAGTAQAGTATSASAADGDVAAAVDALTPRPAAASARAASSGSGPANAASTRQARSPAASAPVAGSSQLVNDLLTQAAGKPGARQPASATSPTASSKGTGKTLSAAVPADGGRTQAGTGTTAAAEQLSARLLAQRQRALDSDPSYVFFRVASDQSGDAGPVGALGVPLTAGRSLAVDPRVMPLGYPVFLDAAPGGKREPHMQRLMFAQDTGGAIRGAVRADYFWGFGSDAGKQARRTKQRGRMWVMVPHAEVQALLSSKLVTRGASAAAQSDCLIQDEAFCLDPADEASLP